MGDEFKSGGGPMNAAKDNATINNYYFSAQKESAPPSFKPGTLFGVPALPPNYFARPTDLEKFRAALLAEGTQAVGITGKRQHVGVQGMGGLGKSVFAAAIARDKDVRAAFPDGIFWLPFRQTLDDAYLLEQQADILRMLEPDKMPKNINHGRNLLNLALQGKRCLFIVDDIWDSRHLLPFDLADTDCRFLLTTRNAEILKESGAISCQIELLSEKQARAMLAECSGFTEESLPSEATAILHECGCLPLAVAAVGSMVRDEPAEFWQIVLKKLQTSRIDTIPANLSRYYCYENLFRVFQVSVEALPLVVFEYYKTLTIFPEDERIPQTLLELYWNYCRLSEDNPLEIISILLKKSLLSRNNDNSVTLHDLLRDYLIRQSGYDAAQLHIILIDVARHLVKESNESNVLIICLKVLGCEAKEAAWRLLETDQPTHVVVVCLKVIGDEGKKAARRLLKERHEPDVISVCLKILGDEVKEDAKRFLKENDNHKVLSVCLKMLGDEVKEDARRFLKESQEPDILIICLKILGDEAKNDARRLLKSGKHEGLLVTCISILGKEAKADAIRLAKTGRNKLTRDNCKELLFSWEDTLGSMFPELARLKKNDAEE